MIVAVSQEQKHTVSSHVGPTVQLESFCDNGRHQPAATTTIDSDALRNTFILPGEWYPQNLRGVPPAAKSTPSVV